MAIFTGNNTVYGYDPVYESYGNAIGGGTDALIEGFSDELAVIEAMHALDMAEIECAKKIKAIREANEEGEITDEEKDEKVEEAEDELAVATEASVKEIWAKIKEWFKNLWNKIKAFFAGLIRNIAAAVMSPKQFLKTYRDKLVALKNIKFTVVTYPYSNLTGHASKISAVIDKSLTSKTLSDLAKIDADNIFDASKDLAKAGIQASKKDNREEFINEIMNKLDEQLNEARPETVKVLTGVSITENDNISDVFYEYHRGAKDPKEITITSVKPYMDLINNADKSIDDVKKAQNLVDKYCAEVTKRIEELSRKWESTTGGARVAAIARKSVSAYSAAQSVVNTAVSVHAKVTKEACNAAKSILAKALSPKSAK